MCRLSHVRLLDPQGLLPAKLCCPWDFPGKNTRVACHFPTPGDIPEPGLKPVSCVSSIGRWIFYHCTTWEPQSLKVVVKSLSHVQLFATPWTAAHQASLSFPTSRSLLKLISIELLNLATLAPWKCTHPPCAHCCSQQCSGPVLAQNLWMRSAYRALPYQL